MPRPSLTADEARSLPHGELIEHVEAILADYDGPQGEPEDQGQLVARLTRTIDEMPQVYRWFNTLWSWLDHWTDFAMNQHGGKSLDYKRLRERRDLMEKAASTAKMRYEGASRIITVLQGFDPTGMPRSRRGPDG